MNTVNRFVSAILLLTPALVLAQPRRESITGRITTDSGVAISGATVSATMAPDRTVRQVTTDIDGRYAFHFDSGRGDYLIHVAALGYRAFRKRVTLAASDTLARLDVRLVSDIARLAAVSVQAKPTRPIRGDRDGNDAGASEREREGVLASLAPDQEGNLAIFGNAIPGATSQAEGLSVLGLDGSQSNVTLNGLAFGGSSLPRDARTTTRVTTSVYDPSRGGFSGGQTAVELSRGSRVALRRAHLTMDSPTLQAPDRFANRLGQRFTSLNGSIGGSGEAVQDVWYYNTALQISRRTADAASLLSVGDDVLSLSGIAPDSAQRLLQLLGAAGVPISGASAPSTTVSQTGSFVGRLDYKPLVKGGTDPSTETWNATVFANIQDDRAMSLSPTAMPSRGGSRTAVFAGAQGVHSRYFGNTLNELRSAFSVSHDHGSPAIALPGGNVIVSSSLPDGSAAVTGLTFGGNGALENDRRSWTWETINETQWYTKANPHKIKLTTELRLDGYRQQSAENFLGSFTFPSLAALAANSPSSFARTLSAPVRDGGEGSGYVALGDYWRVTQRLQLLYGARLEGNRFTSAPAENSSIASLFGANTSHAPSAVHVSPRAGFTWYYGGGEGGTAIRLSQYARQGLPPKGVLRGGFGEFRNFLAPALLSDASAMTGLAGSTSRLVCLGAAVPEPRFADYLGNTGAIPNRCASGAAAFSDGAPTVRLFDRSFDASRSWRGNLSWSSTIKSVGVSLEGIYSLNLDQPGTIDLNFSGAPKFVLSEEGNRPVFVNPSSIVAATGVVSPLEARSSGLYGRVISTRSDLRSHSRQLTATLTPATFGRVYFSAAYTLGSMSGETRGFDGTTFGAPGQLTSASGDFDARHQLQLQIGSALPFGMTVGLFGRFMSGLPYTPRISGDVNGDGIANDRAYVFDPARASDPALAAGMRSLLDGAPTPARDCLLRQLGQPAARNSCRGPWTAFMNARLGIVNRTGFTQRAFSATLNLSNPIGGLDQLLHGSDNLHGWGTALQPDPTLLIVRGFDQTAQRYRYDVNPQFGRSSTSLPLSRLPFRVTVDVNFDLGVPAQKQQAVRLLNPGRGTSTGGGIRTSADSIAAKLARQVPDVYKGILNESDSLLITREQSEALRAAQVSYHAQLDSIWKTASRTLAAMGNDYDADAAMRMIDESTERAWIVGRNQLSTLRGILSPMQLQLAPWVTQLMQTEGKKEVGWRIFSF
jgi:Carboxypeptidase regulatory-like domain